MSVNYTLEKAVTKKSFQHSHGNPLYTGNTNCRRRTLQFFLWCRRMTNRTLCFREYTFSIAIYGPERNKWNKKKAAERREKKQNVDHPQASGSKMQIQRGHKVDCPARIIIKETFMLEGYRHVINKWIHFTGPRAIRWKYLLSHLINYTHISGQRPVDVAR